MPLLKNKSFTRKFTLNKKKNVILKLDTELLKLVTHLENSRLLKANLRAAPSTRVREKPSLPLTTIASCSPDNTLNFLMKLEDKKPQHSTRGTLPSTLPSTLSMTPSILLVTSVLKDPSSN